jgi:hypothetical protein
MNPVPPRFERTPPALSPQLEARLRMVLDAELALPASRPWWHDAVAFVVVTLGLFLVGAFIFNRELSPMHVEGAAWAQAIPLLVVALVAGVAALAPWPQRTSRPWLLGALVAGTVVVTQALTMELSALVPRIGCFAWEVVASLVPAGVALAAARQHAPRLSRVMVLGWASGTVALAVTQLKCPHRDVGHVLVFHLLPLVCVVLATVWARRKLPTTSYAP